MLDRPDRQRLETSSVQFDILGRVNTGMVSIPERLRSQRAERDDDELIPFRADLFENVAGFPGPQIDHEQSGSRLMQHRFQSIDILNMSYLCNGAEKGFYPPNEIRILSI